jgi:hypothetical protein
MVSAAGRLGQIEEGMLPVSEFQDNLRLTRFPAVPRKAMLPLRLLWDRSMLLREEMLNNPIGRVEERRLFAAARDRRRGD